MAGEKTYAELKAEIDAGIKVNGNREITPPIHNAIETALANSLLNKKEGGIVQNFISYLTDLTFIDDKQLVAKKYVDDLITALNALTQGSNTLTEDLTLSGLFKIILEATNASSTLQEDSIQEKVQISPNVYASIDIAPTGAGASYIDNDTPANTSGIYAVPGKVITISDLEINGNILDALGDTSYNVLDRAIVNSSGFTVFDGENAILYDGGTTPVINLTTQQLKYGSVVKVDWVNSALYDVAGNLKYDFNVGTFSGNHFLDGGDFFLMGNKVYWTGSAGADGSLREYYNATSDSIVLEKRIAGVWTELSERG